MREVSVNTWGLERLIGNSQAIKSIRKQAQTARSYDYPVLILGETGVGKTLVARVIHLLSQRSRKPFLHISCSNISSDLMESELFGHERGAFTGAVEKKQGYTDPLRRWTPQRDRVYTE